MPDLDSSQGEHPPPANSTEAETEYQRRWQRTSKKSAQMEANRKRQAEANRVLEENARRIWAASQQTEEQQEVVHMSRSAAFIEVKGPFTEAADASFDPTPILQLIDALPIDGNREAFARGLGTSGANVSRWVNDKTPTGPSAHQYFRMQAVADRFGIAWSPTRGLL